MPLLVKALFCATALSLAFVPSAEAAKKRKPVRLNPEWAGAQVPARYKDSNVFPKGPVYYAGVYLGDDPDPFIRSQLLRDAGARFGGND